MPTKDQIQAIIDKFSEYLQDLLKFVKIFEGLFDRGMNKYESVNIKTDD